MKPLCVASLALLGLLGTAEARLGETIEEIEARVGTLLVRDNKVFPEDCSDGVAEGQGGFDKILFTFFKNDPKKKCVRVQYLKYFEKVGDVNMRFEDAKKLLDKNFPGSKPALDRASLKGIHNGEQTDDFWEAGWEARSGAGAFSSVALSEGQDGRVMYVFSFSCEDAKFTDFMVKGYEKKDRQKEEQKNKAMDAL